MDNLIDNSDRSKLSTVSCLLMGTKAGWFQDKHDGAGGFTMED